MSLRGSIAVSPAQPSAVCFPQVWAGSDDARATVLNLSPRRALAVAELLQVLSCGEESATATFEDIARASQEPAMRSVLMQVAADERQHQLLLSTITAALPRPQIDPAFVARMRRFFMRLADRDVVVHFARIAALDSATCQVLALLRARTNPLASDSHSSSVLRRIHMDEARHVRLARQCAGSFVSSRKGKEIMAEVCSELAQLIHIRADSVEALCIDPDRLHARLRSIPERAGAH
jgi:demethoxyubiquinone hydroxylase (CLK1/Coq7/Cat5 family)